MSSEASTKKSGEAVKTPASLSRDVIHTAYVTICHGLKAAGAFTVDGKHDGKTTDAKTIENVQNTLVDKKSRNKDMKVVGELPTTFDAQINDIFVGLIADVDGCPTFTNDVSALSSLNPDSYGALVMLNQSSLNAAINLDQHHEARFYPDFMAFIKTKSTGKLAVADDNVRLQIAQYWIGFLKNIAFYLFTSGYNRGSFTPKKDDFFAALESMTARHTLAQGRVVASISTMKAAIDFQERQRAYVDEFKKLSSGDLEKLIQLKQNLSNGSSSSTVPAQLKQ
jgi:hypothetical protein